MSFGREPGVDSLPLPAHVLCGHWWVPGNLFFVTPRRGSLGVSSELLMSGPPPTVKQLPRLPCSEHVQAWVLGDQRPPCEHCRLLCELALVA